MNDDLIFKIYKRTSIISLLIMGFSFFIFKQPKPIVLGYLFGVLISMLGFKLLDITINKAVKMNPKRAQAYTTFHYFLRYLIYFIVLSISAIANYLNFLATALGLLMIKFVIIGSTIFDKKFVE
ncbi:MAG TPA: ATP synthase subunit I [Tissierellaceae bacterium]|nr:ATP synthase subunit I [Tissierellaceae bacterium]